MQRITSQSHIDHLAKPLVVAEGGTGVITPAAALGVLQGIPASTIGTIDNPIPLNAVGKINPQYLPDQILADNISLFGTSETYELVPTKYWLSDLDSQQVYTISALHGTVVRDEDVLTYTAPVGITSDTITINNMQYVIAISPSHFETPIIGIMSYNGTNGFSVQYDIVFKGLAPNDNVYLNVEVEVYKSVGGVETLVNVPVDINNDYANVSGLVGNTSYFVKVKASFGIVDTSTELMPSDWGISGLYTTGDVLPDFNSSNVIDGTQLGYVENFGNTRYSVAMSDDGETMIVSTNNGTSGNLYTYITTGGIYDYRLVIASGYSGAIATESPEYNVGVLGGVSGDGNYIFVLEMVLSGASKSIDCQILKRNPNRTYSYLTSVNDVSGNGAYYGTIKAVAVNYDGSVFCITQGAPSIDSPSDRDKLISFFQTSPDWAAHDRHVLYQDLFDGADAVQYPNLSSLSLDTTGSRLVLGARDSEDANSNIVGAAYSFIRNGSSWILEQKFVPNNRVAYGLRYGECVSISRDSNTIAISAIYHQADSDLGMGKVDIWKKINNTWTITNTILNPYTNVAGDAFGKVVKLSADGAYLLVTAPHGDAGMLTGNPKDKGTAYIFKLLPNNSVIKLKDYFYTTGDAYPDQFGFWGDMTASGNRLVIACPKPFKNPALFTSPSTRPNVIIFG